MAEKRRRAKLTGGIATIAIAAVSVAMAMSADSARAAESGFTHFSLVPSTTQAGGHPDTAIDLRWTYECNASGCFGGRVIEVHFPTGVIGNPHVLPTCTLVELNQANCPEDSQIGIFSNELGYEENNEPVSLRYPGYNMETRPDQAGLTGAITPGSGTPIFLDLRGRTDSDYGLDSVSSPIPQAGIFNVTFDLWGVPADTSHNFMRFKTPLSNLGTCLFPNGCVPGQEGQSPTFAPPTVPRAPFIQNPTTCGVPLVAKADIEYYGGAESHAETPYPATTGCQQLSFNPSLALKPTTTLADSPTGVDVKLKVPQTQSPDTPSPSELRTSRVTLPLGFSINPNAADGKTVCTGADTAIGTLLAATCPEFSKVGTLSLDVAALPAPIQGSIYLGEPLPGNRYRLIITADGFGTHVKLPASVRADPQTGQLTAVFEDLPQSPLQEADLHFFGSERGLLATPAKCGVYEVKGEFVPWNSELTTQHTTSYVTVDSGPNGGPCPGGRRPFNPRLDTGSGNGTAGRHAPFSLTLTREDGQQNLAGVRVTTPPGFTATLAGVPYCPEAALALLATGTYSGHAEQAASSCPEASQIGTATAGAGAGSHPFYVPGKVYLAGPYKGAPLSLVVAIPAVSGPYDLGTVAVRAALEVNRATARVTAISDPLPQILEGVPLRARYVRVNLDRPGFTLNPTNCDPFAVNAFITGDEGANASLNAPFQVANCTELPFGPKLALQLKGSTKRTGHPGLTATLTAKPGEANISQAVVTLPHSQFLDNAHLQAPCTRTQFAAGACPPQSVIGSARAETPLLAKPLQGPVYLRTSSNKLPDIVVDLGGQFQVELVGRVDSVKERLRTSFEAVPDVPVTKFSLSLLGGKKGLLINSENLCAKVQKAAVKMTGQNGGRTNKAVRLGTPCKKVKARSKRHGQRQRGTR